MAHQLFHADCIAHMQTMEANSVHSIVTDPPYGLSFMGKDWDHGVPGAHFWQEALRVAKPGAHLLAFGGTRTHHRLVCAIEDAGWEIRDMLMWIYGSGFPKSHNQKGKHTGWGTALKPAWEPIIMARKPLVGTVAANMAMNGTGAINIDGCRVETEDNLNGGAYQSEPSERHDGTESWRFRNGGRKSMPGDDREGAALGMFQDGKTVNALFQQPSGRWPANLIHDGSDEVVECFPNAPGQQRATTGEEERKDTNVYGKSAGVVAMEPRDKGGNTSRFFYCAKASKTDRDEGLTTPEKSVVTFATANGTSGNASSISEGRETAYRNTHPTVKPTALMRYLCRLVTPPEGIVFDPFMGSGSTGKAAILEGFSFTGTDLQAEYLEIAKARCEWAQKEHQRLHAQTSMLDKFTKQETQD